MKDKNKNIKCEIIDRPDKDFAYISSNCFTPPESDKISIYILNEEVDANFIFKVVDDITEYLTSEIGFNLMQDVLIVYDDENAPVDRFGQFF